MVKKEEKKEVVKEVVDKPKKVKKFGVELKPKFRGRG